jgi:hypothetical protein
MRAVDLLPALVAHSLSPRVSPHDHSPTPQSPPASQSERVRCLCGAFLLVGVSAPPLSLSLVGCLDKSILPRNILAMSPPQKPPSPLVSVWRTALLW